MEKIDISNNELLNDFLYAVCSKLGLDFDGDFLNSSFGNFIVYAKNGYIVRTKKKGQQHILSQSDAITSLIQQ